MRQYPVPKTEQEFERFCLEFLRRYWKRPRLDLYAKRGEKQHGVDIVDTTDALDAWAAQCKLHEATKTLPPAEIKSEVLKVKTFPQALQRYAICTTARKTAAAQDCVMEINAEHQAKGLFTVQIIYWDEIEAYLDQDEDLVDRLTYTSYASIRTMLRDERSSIIAGIATMFQPALEAATANSYDAELDRAKGLLDRHQRAAAEALLLDIKSRSFDRLTPLQKFRCLTMLGAIVYNNGDIQATAEFFVRAHDAYPEHERAVANLAHAELLLGHSERAWDLAQTAFRRHPTNTHVAAIYIALAPQSISVQELLSTLSDDTARHSHIVCTIANRYLVEGHLDEAISWSRRVEGDNDLGHHALLTLGQALLKAGTTGDPASAANASPARNSLTEASAVLERAAVQAEARGEHRLAIQARLHQLDAIDPAKDAYAFEAIVEDGLRIAANVPAARSRFLLARAQLHVQQGDLSRAVRDTEKALELDRSPDARAMYASCLWNRNDGSDRIMARREMARLLDDVPVELLEQCTDFMVRSCLADNLGAAAADALRLAEKRGLDPGAVLAYRAQIARAENRVEDARQAARDAAQRLTDGSSRATRKQVANTLASVGLEMDALPILERLASYTELTNDTRTLIHCALRAERHDLVLTYCEQLRKAGVREARLLETEIGLLEKYDPAKAVDTIEGLLQENPYQPMLRVRRCLLGVRLNSPQLLSFRLEDAPHPNEVDAGYVQATVECFIRNGFYAQAVEYAYRCLHRFPDKPTSHIAFMRSTLLVRSDLLEGVLAAPTEACIGCAIEYQEDGDSQTVRCVIEDDVARVFPDMIDAASPTARALLGHRVGDQIVLARGSTRDRTARIRKIVNRYVYRMNECLSSWQLKFPEIRFLEQVRMDPDPQTGHLDLGPIVKGLQAYRDLVQHADDCYRTGLVSVPFMAEFLGRNVFETMWHLATDEELFVNCAFVTAEVQQVATQRLRQASGLVLDITAVWTLHALQLLHIIERMPVPIAVVQPTIDEVRSNLKEGEASHEQTRGILRLVGDKIGFAEISPEVWRAEHDKWDAIASTLERCCGLLGAKLLASLEPHRRDKLQTFVGEGSAHAAAAAGQAKYLLWTDDRVHEFVAKEFFGVERVWTQVVLGWLCEVGVLNETEFLRASARLEAFHYSGTWVNPGVLVEAGRLANWQANSVMIQRNLRVLGDRNTPPASRLATALEFIIAVNKEVALDVSRDALILATLERLRDHPVGLRIVREITRQLRSVMWLEPLRARQVLATIQAWLAAERNRFVT
ncbi:hypothetical protein WMF04_01755 [Sorangium sp. So ce260]|uniref:PIN domain-containing protein n=1 Tax=Sorangium sp. So ce260 TaxID=3133291 RepID=UPI003F5F5140